METEGMLVWSLCTGRGLKCASCVYLIYLEIMMKVYSLLGFVSYEGSELFGVFGSLEDLLKCVEEGRWFCDELGYVESELGDVIGNVLGEVEYVSFVRYNGKVHSV